MIEALSHDTSLWVAISFILFLIVAFKLGRKSVTRTLDSRIEEIRKEIETAESLRVEAQELLAQYQRKQRDAEKEAQQIVDNAKAHADKIQARAKAELQETMQRREEQLTERVRRIEENAVASIQNYAAELALEATREIIAGSLDKKANENIAGKSIQDIAKHLN